MPFALVSPLSQPCANDAEYVRIETIVPRLYLATRLVIDVAQDKVK